MISPRRCLKKAAPLVMHCAQEHDEEARLFSALLGDINQGHFITLLGKDVCGLPCPWFLNL